MGHNPIACHSCNGNLPAETCTRVCGPISVEGDPLGEAVRVAPASIEWPVSTAIDVPVGGAVLLLPARERVGLFIQNISAVDLRFGPDSATLDAGGGIHVCAGQPLVLPDGYCGTLYVKATCSGGCILLNEFRLEGAV